MTMVLNKRIGVIIFVVVILAILGCVAIIYTYRLKSPQSESSAPQNELGKVSYIIDYGEGNVASYQVDVYKNSTVFSLLENLAKRENFNVETASYPKMGVFVKSIGGAEGGTDNKWWQYWVNGNLGEVGADKKEIKPGDTIEWKFEIIQF